MEKRYFQITFHFSGPIVAKVLEPTFYSLADDWIRYSSNCWIAYSAKDPADWFNALKPLLGPNDQMLILELKKNQGVLQGWLPKWIWDWLNKRRN
jgi:hypothetical protein